MKLRIGCSGWSYRAWVGPFYPSHTSPDRFLQLYSKVFDSVEIDSTFYGIPAAGTVESWRKSTPEDFRFYPKIPGEITHEKRLANSGAILDSFIETMNKLGSRLGTILVQLPPFFRYMEGFDDLEKFIGALPEEFRFAMEFRHDSWFRKEVFSALERAGVTFAWSEAPFAEIPAIMTSQDVYLRLVGDRSLGEREFGAIRLNKSASINKWAAELKSREDEIASAHVFSNNHFQGFGPGTANQFLEALGRKPVNWQFSMLPDQSDRQKKLF